MPDLRAKIMKYVAQCKECNENKISQQKQFDGRIRLKAPEKP